MEPLPPPPKKVQINLSPEIFNFLSKVSFLKLLSVMGAIGIPKGLIFFLSIPLLTKKGTSLLSPTIK